ncbi:hypothetical protein CRG98_023830 [Punica granatum]|uniref:Uncharacterized protein n=1 Tax=Punica granatum TaxID=22663 RepID=A0A2I0JJP7_PUNGR|nr:hypothetical protein CRG98_023830 [Punica granatum]
MNTTSIPPNGVGIGKSDYCCVDSNFVLSKPAFVGAIARLGSVHLPEEHVTDTREKESPLPVTIRKSRANELSGSRGQGTGPPSSRLGYQNRDGRFTAWIELVTPVWSCSSQGSVNRLDRFQLSDLMLAN